MSIDTLSSDLHKKAGVLRNWDDGNEHLALRLEERAAHFESLKNRKPLVVSGTDRYPLDSEEAAWVLAERVLRKLDPQHSGEVEAYLVGEPGYGENVTVLANWNRYPKWQAVIEKLERLGCPLTTDWSDEWVSCYECNKAYRSSPDSYGWVKSWWYGPHDCDIICAECTRKNMLDEYLEYLSENHDHADTFLDDGDLEDAGWQRVGAKLEHGLYGGQAADPKKVAAWVYKQGHERCLFKIDSTGQFDVDFSVWVPADETVDEGAVNRAYWNGEMNGPDPATMMKQALKSLNNKPPTPAGMIEYNKIDLGTGTAETRYLTPDEFIGGAK